MPRSIQDTSVAIGFIQVPVSVYKATQDEKLRLTSLCENCGKPPHQRIVCENPSCGTELPKPEDAQAAVRGGQTLIEGQNGVPVAAKSFQSWYHVGGRGYERSEGDFVQMTQAEIKEAKASAQRYDAITVTKTVDFKKLAMEHVLGEPYYLLPQLAKGKTEPLEATLKAYRLVTEALDQGGMALLCYMTMRENTHRLAIVADSRKNILVAYEIRDARDIPYTAKQTPVNAAERQQAEAILKGQWSDDAHIDAAPDPVMALLEQKLAESAKIPGLGATTMVPQ